jgi:hypothetical protein
VVVVVVVAAEHSAELAAAVSPRTQTGSRMLGGRWLRAVTKLVEEEELARQRGEPVEPVLRVFR